MNVNIKRGVTENGVEKWGENSEDVAIDGNNHVIVMKKEVEKFGVITL